MSLTMIAAEPVPLSMDDTGTVRVKGTRLTLDTILGAYERGDLPAAAIVGLAVSSGVVEGRARVLVEMGAAESVPTARRLLPELTPTSPRSPLSA